MLLIPLIVALEPALRALSSALQRTFSAWSGGANCRRRTGCKHHASRQGIEKITTKTRPD